MNKKSRITMKSLLVCITLSTIAIFLFSNINVGAWTTADCLGTGGNQVYIDGNSCVHVFNNSGTFNLSGVNSLNVSVMVIGGGGGGGGTAGVGSAGAGASGGFLINGTYNVSANINVAIGNGGVGGFNGDQGTAGTNSVFGSLTALGGGYGGSSNNGIGGNGGSGGGAWSDAGVAGGVGSQGGNGGSGGGAGPGGGGGGGAGGNGGDFNTGILGSPSGGDGGYGKNSTINGTLVCYAGGGGGSSYSGYEGVGKCGGGRGSQGDSAPNDATAGTDGLGAGGGGAERSGTKIGGKGGNGIVIVRYLAGGGADTTKPTNVFNYQLPPDVNSFNAVVRGVNISYNMSDDVALNVSTAQIFYKSNSTTRNIITFINGSGISEYISHNYISNISGVFQFGLEDNEVYPATYNINEIDFMENAPKTANVMGALNNYVAIQFLNMTNTTRYGWFETMSNSTGIQAMYYCNSSYLFNSNPATSSRCVLFNTIPANQPYNHTHSPASKHQVIPIAINITDGTLGGIKVTDTSWLLIRGNSGTGNNVVYYSITNTSRRGAIRTTTNTGASWTNQTYTVDAHLHQFSGNSSLYYFTCVNDTSNNQNCSSIMSDLYDLAGLPPEVFVYTPIEQIYSNSINITYLAMSPNSYDIRNYTISLLNTSYSIKSIIVSNTTNSSYLWNTTTTTDGNYIISVMAMDSENQSTIGYSTNFTIDNTFPNAVLVTPSNGTRSTNFTQNYTVNVSDTLGLKNATLFIYNKTSSIISQTTIDLTGTMTNIVGIVVTLVDGVYDWFYNVFDLAGNMFTSGNNTITLGTLNFNSVYANKSFRITEFIKVNGTNFTLAGKPYHIIGANFYYAIDYMTGTSWSDNGEQINNSDDQVYEGLNELQSLNINVIRTWMLMQGGNQNGTNATWGIKPNGGHWNLAEKGYPGNYSEDYFVALDRFTSECSKRDIRPQYVALNQWEAYGGKQWYLSMSSTSNKTYENATYLSDNWWTWSDQFYDDVEANTYFRNALNYTLNRNNTITGILYKDDPTIFSIMLMNEPRLKTNSQNHTKIAKWCNDTIAFAKTIDSKHLYTCGIEGLGFNETWGEGSDLITTYNNSNSDYVTFASNTAQWIYMVERNEVWNDNQFMCTADSSSCNIGNDNVRDFWGSNSTQGYTYDSRYSSGVPLWIPKLDRHNYTSWTTQNVKWANAMNKPIMMQELVVQQTYNDVTKDDLYTKMMNSFYQNGGDGVMIWQYLTDAYNRPSSTAISGNQDDGFGFYVSDNATLKAQSTSTIKAINLTKNSGYVTLLNNYKYDFTFNLNIGSGINLQNCSLFLNVSNATAYTGNNLNLTNTSEVVSGVDYIFQQQFNPPQKELTWYVSCFDDTNTAYSTTPQYVLLQTGTPVVTRVSPNNQYFNYTPTLSYNVTDSLDISNCKLYVNDLLDQTDSTITKDITQSFIPTVGSSGYYNWSVECIDTGNNIAYSDLGNFTLDLLNPTVILNTPSNGTINLTEHNQNLTVNLTDNIGIKNTTLYINGVFNQTITFVEGKLDAFVGIVVNLIDGLYNWFYDVFDWGGNHATSENNTLLIDTAYPLIDWGYNTLNDGANKSQSNIYLNTTWTEVNFANITFRENNNEMTFSSATYNHNFTSLPDGVYYYNTTICDLANQCNTTSTRKITLDTLAPSINITTPKNNSWLDHANVQINITLVDLNPASCWYSNDTYTLNVSITCGNNITLNFPQGQHNFTFWINDFAGNTNSSTIVFYVDTTFPNLFLVSPNDGANLTSTTRFIGNASDNLWLDYSIFNVQNSSLATVYARVDNFPASTLTSLLNYTTTYLRNDTYIWRYAVCDFAGNCNVTPDWHLLVDAEIPKVTLISPTGSITPGITNFTADVSDNLGLSNVTLLIFNSTSVNTNRTLVSFSPASLSKRLGINVNLTVGSYNWTYYAYDYSGNFFMSANQTIEVAEVIPPTPPAGGGGGSGTLTFNYTGSNDTILCNGVYYFIINHLNNSNNLVYTDGQLNDFYNSISVNLGSRVNETLAKSYVDNFELCSAYTNKRIPSIGAKGTPILDFGTYSDINLVNCSVNLDSTFLFYNLDTSIPFFNVYNGDMSCDSINVWRWLVRIEQSENGYVVNGLKLNLVIVPLIIWVLYLLIKIIYKKAKQVN